MFSFITTIVLIKNKQFHGPEFVAILAEVVIECVTLVNLIKV